jgi:hypothetical protein
MTRRKRYYPKKVPPGMRAFIHLTRDEFEMLGLDEWKPGRFRDPPTEPWRCLAGDMVLGDPFRERFDIRIDRLVLSLPWSRMVQPCWVRWRMSTKS